MIPIVPQSLLMCAWQLNVQACQWGKIDIASYCGIETANSNGRGLCLLESARGVKLCKVHQRSGDQSRSNREVVPGKRE